MLVLDGVVRCDRFWTDEGVFLVDELGGLEIGFLLEGGDAKDDLCFLLEEGDEKEESGRGMSGSNSSSASSDSSPASAAVAGRRMLVASSTNFLYFTGFECFKFCKW